MQRLWYLVKIAWNFFLSDSRVWNTVYYEPILYGSPENDNLPPKIDDSYHFYQKIAGSLKNCNFDLHMSNRLEQEIKEFVILN